MKVLLSQRICPRIIRYNKHVSQSHHQIKTLVESSLTPLSTSPSSFTAAASVPVSSRYHGATDQFSHEAQARSFPMNYLLAAAGLLALGSGTFACDHNSVVILPHIGILRDAYCEAVTGHESMLIENNQFTRASSPLDNICQRVSEFSG